MTSDTLGPLVLILLAGYMAYKLYKNAAARKPDAKKDKALLTVSGDKERIEASADGAIRLHDGKLTIPKAIQMIKHTKSACIQNDALAEPWELQGSKEDQAIFKAVIAVENEMAQTRGASHELIFLSNASEAVDQDIVQQVMDFYAKQMAAQQVQTEDGDDPDHPLNIDPTSAFDSPRRR